MGISVSSDVQARQIDTILRTVGGLSAVAAGAAGSAAAAASGALSGIAATLFPFATKTVAVIGSGGASASFMTAGLSSAIAGTAGGIVIVAAGVVVIGFAADKTARIADYENDLMKALLEATLMPITFDVLKAVAQVNPNLLFTYLTLQATQISPTISLFGR